MLLKTPHIVSSLPRLLIAPLILIVCFLYLVPARYNVTPAFGAVKVRNGNYTKASSTFSKPVVDFWQEFASSLVAAEPECSPLQLQEDEGDSAVKFEPLQPNKKHESKLFGFTDADETALLRAHYSMRRSAQELAPSLPFAQGSMGIVTTANSDYMPVFLVSLRMLRKTGCSLPVEVFIDDWTKYDAHVCDTVMPSMNARCIVLSEIYDTNTEVKKPDHYQYKVLSMLFSSFQHVLFLDSDAFPAYDPTDLLFTAPYTTHGLVTWPDYFALMVSQHFYHIAAIPEEPASARYSTESGQLLINKNIHRESLLMMVYYNYYGPDYYYPLLCQGGPGAGDKETFVQAAMAVGLPWYQVRTGPGALGRPRDGEFRGTGMGQADPRKDYAYLPPMQSHIHTDSHWQPKDASVPPKAHSRPDPPRPKPFFIHQNSLKLDPAKMLEDIDQNVYEPDGTPHRMWGKERDMIDLVGYDIERRLWDAITEEACREDRNGAVCLKVKNHVQEVFGGRL